MSILRKPLGLLGVFLIVVGFGYFVGAGVAYSKTQGGYHALQAFSEVQNVELTYDDQGQLTDRGETAGGQAILDLLRNDWDFPVVMGKGGLDPNDPLVNNSSEYMYQMATIAHHTLTGVQTVDVTADQIAAAEEAGTLDPDGTYNGVVAAYQGQVITPGSYDVPVDGRYWTGFDRTDLLDGPARELAWSGTTHALVAELGVGAGTHSSLMLALGIAGLLAGLGVVTMVMGVAFLWETKRRDGLAVPDTIPDAFLKDQPERATV
ncbi:MAG: hypothetical protein ABIO83_08255 [Ilumatobacteraceae bacterium]